MQIQKRDGVFHCSCSHLSHRWQFTVYITSLAVDALIYSVVYFSTSLVLDKFFDIAYCILNYIWECCNF